MKLSVVFFTIIFSLSSLTFAKEAVSPIWNADNLKGAYKNPIIHADYSDPDIVRVGDDFFMAASSFNSIPGLPILHSKDLVNWNVINHALQANVDPYFDIPQHGKGVWAPSIRYHQGYFYIYWGDPDRGIFMVKTDNPRGEWSAPILVKKGFGNIDPTPLWDDDGKVYMVHAYANSRAGIKNIISIEELSSDASASVGFGRIVFDGTEKHPTIEGPKLYKRNDYYYIFAPAGGVTQGWQVVLRSKNIYGPYEDRIVLAQGRTSINGPHQGGLVDLANGESWFVHFQDKDAYGRVIHLQPVQWVNDWPVIGVDKDNDGIGEPVTDYKKPNIGVNHKADNPQDSDEFSVEKLGLQWQWNANPKPHWASFNKHSGFLRLQSVVQPQANKNLWSTANLLTQKIPAQAFSASTKVDISKLKEDEEFGLVLYGLDYAVMNLKKTAEGYNLGHEIVINAESTTPNINRTELNLSTVNDLWFKTEISPLGKANFFYSLDGKKYLKLGGEFLLRPGKWVGAQIGLYANRYVATGEPGYVDIDWFRIEQ